ncbi:hypothetical protein Gotur_034276 [Gossypium turneri]
MNVTSTLYMPAPSASGLIREVGGSFTPHLTLYLIPQRKHFNFIYCIENQGLPIKDNQHSDGMEAVWKACSARSGMDQKLIKDCYDSGYGRKASFFNMKLDVHNQLDLNSSITQQFSVVLHLIAPYIFLAKCICR